MADDQLVGELGFGLLRRNNPEGAGHRLRGVGGITVLPFKEPAPLIAGGKGRGGNGKQHGKAENAGEKLFHPEQTGNIHILIHSSHPRG